MGYRDDYRRDEQRREDYRRDDQRRQYAREDQQRRDYIDQDNLDYDRQREDERFKRCLEDERRRRVAKAIANDYTAGVIAETMGPGAAADYLRQKPITKKSNKQKASECFELAKKAQKEGDHASAINHLDRGLTHQPANSYLLYEKAISLFIEKAFDEAVDVLTQALASCPDSDRVELLYRRGMCHVEAGNLDRSEADFNKVILADAQHKEAYFWRGKCRIRGKKYEDAIDDFTIDLKHNPKQPDSLHQRGMCYYLLGQYAQAVTSLRAATRGASNPRWFNHLGMANQVNGQFKKAIRAYSKAIELDEKMVAAWSNRGDAYIRLGKYDQALSDFKQELKLNEESWYALEGIGRCHEGKGEHSLAIESFSAALNFRPDHFRLLQSRAYNLFQLEQLDEARLDCNRAIGNNPESAWSFMLRGRINAKSPAKGNDAMRDFNEAIRLKQNLRRAHIYRAKFRIKLGDLEGALADFDREVQMFPDSGFPLFERGKFLNENGQSGLARKDFLKATKLFTLSDDKIGLKKVEAVLLALD